MYLVFPVQGRNHKEIVGAIALMVGRICPPGCNRVKVSENLVANSRTGQHDCEYIPAIIVIVIASVLYNVHLIALDRTRSLLSSL